MTMYKRTGRGGIVSVLAVILLAVLSGLSVAMVAFTNSSVQQAGNHARVQSAQFQAEGGLAICLRNIAAARISPNVSDQQMLSELATQLTPMFKPLLGEANVTYPNGVISVPHASLGDGKSFCASMQLTDMGKIRLAVTGKDGDVTRSVTIECYPKAVRSRVFDFGLASNSPIAIKGEILDAAELLGADILTASYATDSVVTLGSQAVIEGEIFISNPSGYATWGNHVTVAGTTSNIAEHIHAGIGPVTFPQVNVDKYESMSLTVLTDKFPQNLTFTDIRIPANTKTSFAGGTTINGVLFIEAPNEVTFSGNCTINGVIVTQDASSLGDDSSLSFSGNVAATGLNGTCLLAPGFDVSMSGNASAVNGCMAAENFKLSGNAGGVIVGTLINYGNEMFEMTGNAKLTIVQTPDDHLPDGFLHAMMLVPDMDTYKEL
jgi:hypothetical protein